MKKLWKTLKYKRYMRRKAARSFAAQLWHKEWRRRRRQLEVGLSKVERKVLHRTDEYRKPWVVVVAPEYFSFVNNPEDMCRFIRKLDQCLRERKPVFVELFNVETIDYDGIVVLLSAMVRFKSEKIKFNGSNPSNRTAKKLLIESNFFSHLEESRFRHQDAYNLTTQGSIVTHAMRSVDSELTERIIADTSQTVWGERRRCRGCQRTLIELMQNTINHASLDREGEKHWWLSVKLLPEQHRVAFSFVDYGVGIFNNLRQSSNPSRILRGLDGFVRRYLLGMDNASILREIFSGAIHRTATRLPFRGKGLPGIYDANEKNHISNLAMISNDVFYNSKGDTYQILKTPFEGTFVYWEMCAENPSLPHAP